MLEKVNNILEKYDVELTDTFRHNGHFACLNSIVSQEQIEIVAELSLCWNSNLNLNLCLQNEENQNHSKFQEQISINNCQFMQIFLMHKLIS